jgi:SRSO17 transposase
MQSVLGRSRRDADALRDLVRDEVFAYLGDGNGVLVVDETGFLKKGTHSVGVARQYSGPAGRVENCKVGVFLGYASRLGQALIDRRLYLPECLSEIKASRRSLLAKRVDRLESSVSLYAAPLYEVYYVDPGDSSPA